MQPSPQYLSAVQALVREFKGSITHLRLLHHGEGMVFETICAGQPVIIKVIVTSVSAIDSLQARLLWIRYLHENNLFVPELLLSRNDSLVEEIAEDDTFLTAYAYRKIPLAKENEINWNDSNLSHQLGVTIGRMHHLAKTYGPPMKLPFVEQWDEAEKSLISRRKGFLNLRYFYFSNKQLIVLLLHLRTDVL
jgi:Ser/Thr protein kinase RdoA (MazF antagonist)